jgi:hypothetical protein
MNPPRASTTTNTSGSHTRLSTVTIAVPFTQDVSRKTQPLSHSVD